MRAFYVVIQFYNRTSFPVLEIHVNNNQICGAVFEPVLISSSIKFAAEFVSHSVTLSHQKKSNGKYIDRRCNSLDTREKIIYDL